MKDNDDVVKLGRIIVLIGLIMVFSVGLFAVSTSTKYFYNYDSIKLAEYNEDVEDLPHDYYYLIMSIIGIVGVHLSGNHLIRKVFD